MLQSMKEILGYRISAIDGEIGKVRDWYFDDRVWIVRYMIVDTRNWLPGRKVIIAPGWIDKVSWEERKVYVELNKELVKNGPEFDPSFPINRQYEERLYDYYGRPKYWSGK